MEKGKIAIENHKKGYNCAQAVACTFAKEMNFNEKELFRMTEGFGFGMGTMGTCGAVSAMAVIAGLSESDGDIEIPKTKRNSYKAMKAMTKKFEEMNQSVICKEIKGVSTGKVLRNCDGCIEDAANIVEEYLKSTEGR